MPFIGIGISPMFQRFGGGSATQSVLQPWYDSLSVKPSAGLWTDLQIMADGMNTDGDWGEMDILYLAAALETDEQRLKPLKTSSNSDVTNISNILTFTSEGAIGDAAGGLNFNWNPGVHGVKFALNSAFVGYYMRTSQATNGARALYTGDRVPDSYLEITRSIATSTITQTSRPNVLNTALSLAAISKSKTGSTVPYFIGTKRKPDNDNYNFLSGVKGTMTSFMPSVLANYTMGVYIYNDNTSGTNTITLTEDTLDNFRLFVSGSGLIDEDRIASRINTFFTSRGLSIFT